jgi:hypothetical protein
VEATDYRHQNVKNLLFMASANQQIDRFLIQDRTEERNRKRDIGVSVPQQNLPFNELVEGLSHFITANRPLEPTFKKTTLGLDAVTAPYEEGFDFVELGQTLGGDWS